MKIGGAIFEAQLKLAPPTLPNLKIIKKSSTKK